MELARYLFCLILIFNIFLKPKEAKAIEPIMIVVGVAMVAAIIYYENDDKTQEELDEMFKEQKKNGTDWW
jgi:hypothetical protein